MAKNDHDGEKSHFSARLTNPFRRPHDSNQAMAPSPPSRQPFPRKEEFQPPPGPPPGYTQPSNAPEIFQPPPGPPPSSRQAPSHPESFQPPPGPPPSTSLNPGTQPADVQPPEYAPWMSIPDTSQLPPPPSITYEESPTANATPLSADQARTYTRTHPLDLPRHLLSTDRSRIESHDVDLARPGPSFSGKLSRLAQGTWQVQTRPSCGDTVLVSQLPLYCALEDSARTTARQKTVYFEIRVVRMGVDASLSSAYAQAEAEAGIAIGFVAAPYPHWRLPGWERASLGVHGDDGRKYIHNNMGGQDFTTSFKDGEVVGIGMTFSPPRAHGAKGGVEVFFTREGQREGGWNLYEERDGDDEGSVEGLGGDRDLFAAIGSFGGVDLETRFRRDQWLYRPQR